MKIIPLKYLFCILLIACVVVHSAAQKFDTLTHSQLMDMGRTYMNRELPDSAFFCFMQVANRYYSDRPKGDDLVTCVKAMNNLGYLYFYYYYDFEKSYDWLLRGQDIAQKENMSKILPHLYLNLSNLYLLDAIVKHPDAPLDSCIMQFKNAFHASITANEYRLTITVFNNLLNLAFLSDHIDAITPEIDIFKSTEFPDSIPLRPLTEMQLAGIEASLRGDTTQAIIHFNKMEHLIDEHDTPERQILISIIDKAQMYQRADDIEKALATLFTALNTARQADVKDAVVEYNYRIASLYDSLGDTLNAGRYRLRYYEARDSLLYESKLAGTEKSRVLFDLQMSQEQLVEMSHRRQIHNIVMWIIIGMVIVVMAFLFLVMRNYRTVKIKNEQLYRANVKMLQENDRYRQATNSLTPDGVTSAKGLSPRSSYKEISEDKKANIIADITRVMNMTDEICQEDFSLTRLAELAGHKYKDISQIINETWNKNFYLLLSEYRIDEACRRMNNKDSEKLTIEAIAQSVGFKSRSNFAVTFKKVTGLTPSEYQRLRATSIQSQAK